MYTDNIGSLLRDDNTEIEECYDTYILSEMMSLLYKGLLGSSILLMIALVTLLSSKRYSLESRKKDKDALLLDIIANISGTIDKLSTGFDGMAMETEMARSRLKQLVALHRENAAICAMLHKQRKKKISRKTTKRL